MWSVTELTAVCCMNQQVSWTVQVLTPKTIHSAKDSSVGTVTFRPQMPTVTVTEPDNQCAITKTML